MSWTDLRLTNPVSGALLSEWRFAEGSGTTVADSVGSNPINLATPTTPNYTWTSRGISLAAGLVQTASITGARTVVLLYKVSLGESAGFILSGGSASGAGVQGDGISMAYTNHVGVARGVKPLLYAVAAGNFARQLNRGSWVLLITDFATAYNTILGLGGRHSTTASRCATFEVAYCAVYSGTLVAAERQQIYEMARQLAVSRSFYLDWRDCPTMGEVVMLNGQSNGEGSALLSELSAPDAARTTPNTYILRRNDTSVALMVRGTNQQTVAPATQFGPELGLAWKFEDSLPSTDLYLSKFAIGSSFLASTGAVDWNVNEAVSSGHLYQALINLWTLEAFMLNNGIGPRLRGMAWMQGEQDATSDATSVLYATNLRALIDKYREQVADPAAKFVIARIRDQDPAFDATAVVQVRLFQEVVGESDPNVSWFDTDSMSLRADLVHYNAAGAKALGEALYNQFFPMEITSDDLPAVGQVASGVDRGDGQLGTRTDAAVSSVLTSHSYGAGGNSLTGTYVAPAVAAVLDTVSFGAASALTGTWNAPTISEVVSGVTFGPSSSLTGTATDYADLAADVTAIKAKTDQLVFTSGNVHAELDSATSTQITTIAEVLGAAMRGDRSHSEALDLILAATVGKSSQPSGTTERFKFLDDADAFTTTFDANGNRTAVALS